MQSNATITIAPGKIMPMTSFLPLLIYCTQKLLAEIPHRLITNPWGCGVCAL